VCYMVDTYVTSDRSNRSMTKFASEGVGIFVALSMANIPPYEDSTAVRTQ
jgi:hypothetical protein